MIDKMNNEELILALKAISKERGIQLESLVDALESALVSAYKKNVERPSKGDGFRRNNAANCKARANVDMQTGKIEIWVSKAVVETVEDEYSQISIEKARAINPLLEIGDVVEEEADTKNFGRIAAQTAKGVITQRIREAERGAIYEEYQEKEYEVLTAIVERIDKNSGIYVEIGKIAGLIPFSESISGENYAEGDRLKVYVLKVQKDNKGPQIIVSRTHPGLVKRLFELEIPEIQSGIIQIRSIAREAGQRTKIAVSSSDSMIDAVGACVGQRGVRVERIVSELHNEKMDIIEWDSDIAVYIAKALGPAKVLMVYINEAEKAAKVIVPDNQLSLAIGKEGQNARLAAKLTGWKIDIKSQSQAEEDMKTNSGEDCENADITSEVSEEFMS